MDIHFDSLHLIHQPKNSDAGYDLSTKNNVILRPYVWTRVNTGVRVHIPPGNFGLVLSRSGLRFKDNVHCSPGVIDSGYIGDIKLLMRWEPNTPFIITIIITIIVGFFSPIIGTLLMTLFIIHYYLIGKRFHHGSRLAQMIVIPTNNFYMNYVQHFNDECLRGENGFGSSGLQ